jgi:hypothetical protein
MGQWNELICASSRYIGVIRQQLRLSNNGRISTFGNTGARKCIKGPDCRNNLRISPNTTASKTEKLSPIESSLPIIQLMGEGLLLLRRAMLLPG